MESRSWIDYNKDGQIDTNSDSKQSFLMLVLMIMTGCHTMFGKPVCKGHSGLQKVVGWSQQSHWNGRILNKDYFGVAVKRDKEK